jgi:hypothetical protein
MKGIFGVIKNNPNCEFEITWDVERKMYHLRILDTRYAIYTEHHISEECFEDAEFDLVLMLMTKHNSQVTEMIGRF